MKIDLHTHTHVSPDAGIRFGDLRDAYKAGMFDLLAITDHNQISEAKKIKQEKEFPVIVGEEISTKEGDLIGLYLREPILQNQGFLETLRAVREQGGLVLVPHPFDLGRTGISRQQIKDNRDRINFVEVVNGRALATFPKVYYPRPMEVFLQECGLLAVACSDAHETYQIGRAGVRLPQSVGKDAAWEAADNPEVLLSLVQKGKIEFERGNYLKAVIMEWGFIARRGLEYLMRRI